jgi:molybdopterin-binding protein
MNSDASALADTGGEPTSAIDLPPPVDAHLPRAHAAPMMHAMAKALYTAAEAARALGISLDTLRRWDRSGKIRTRRDAANRRVVAASEIARLRGDHAEHLSARNRFRGVVSAVRVEGLLAQVEIDVAGPARVVAVITRDAVEELGLEAGAEATAVVKATSVMVER